MKFPLARAACARLALRLCALLLLAGCDPSEFDGVRVDLDAALSNDADPAQAAPDPTGSSESDAGRDAGAHDATVRDASADAATDLDAGDATVRMDLCGNVRPTSPALSGVRADSIEMLPAMAQHPSVIARGPATSTLFAGRVLWMFGAGYDNTVAYRVIASSSYGRSGLDRPYLLDEAQPGALPPATLLADLPADRAQVAAGQALLYELGSVISIGLGDALLFYTPAALNGSGSTLGITRLGTRVARLRGDFTSLSAELVPELLFPSGAPPFRNGLLASDGYVYLYGCPQKSDGHFDCKLARAPLGSATRASSYRYRTTGGWSNDPSVATAVLSDVRDDLSVSFNAYLQSYLAVSFVWIDRRIVLLTAPRPEGPWTHFGELEVPPLDADAGEFLSAAIEHAELASNCGKSLVLTYVRPLKGNKAELRPIKLELR